MTLRRGGALQALGRELGGETLGRCRLDGDQRLQRNLTKSGHWSALSAVSHNAAVPVTIVVDTGIRRA